MSLVNAARLVVCLFVLALGLSVYGNWRQMQRIHELEIKEAVSAVVVGIVLGQPKEKRSFN